jgi:hypothetical protein
VQLSREDGADTGAEPGDLAGSLEAAAAFVKGHASIRTCMVERIDRLRPSQQLTLKVPTAIIPCQISVRGTTFAAGVSFTNRVREQC